MTSLACGHDDIAGGQICVHLLEKLVANLTSNADLDLDNIRWFDGKGYDYALVCGKACSALSQPEKQLVAICGKCFFETESGWRCEGVLGKAVVPERATGLDFAHHEIRLTGLPSEPIADICPLNGLPENVWLAVTDNGKLLRLDLEQLDCKLICVLPENVWTGKDQVSSSTTAKGEKQERVIHIDARLHIHTSDDGRFAAVVNDRGKYGAVVLLETGELLMALDRVSTSHDASKFPLAFFEREGRMLLVHATQANRLDISDPLSGELLTERGPMPTKYGEPHALDYYHADLTVSPDGEWVADWGWCWHPVGWIATWSVRRWLEKNVWESEDGETRRRFCDRAYYWGGPTFWADNRTLAIWGYGDDDDNLIPAICFFDVRTGGMLRWFQGPEGELIYDQYVFSFSQEAGMQIWDVDTGERLLHQPGFCPKGYHRRAKSFLTLMPDGSFRISRLVGEQG